jgi:hypothetical protein
MKIGVNSHNSKLIRASVTETPRDLLKDDMPIFVCDLITMATSKPAVFATLDIL